MTILMWLQQGIRLTKSVFRALRRISLKKIYRVLLTNRSSYYIVTVMIKG